ncbi:hypothetical protein FOZ60_006486 [Perkinsus olseni]|uniref:Uncharacterized protein n=1 Tax=Perkinsus olseni TaxID=32597 RepID=A0A7J6PFK9_PEROL|nr:hypothetical protein FOZ60_006486 [Perkinsus olseni]
MLSRVSSSTFHFNWILLSLPHLPAVLPIPSSNKRTICSRFTEEMQRCHGQLSSAGSDSRELNTQFIDGVDSFHVIR